MVACFPPLSVLALFCFFLFFFSSLHRYTHRQIHLDEQTFLPFFVVFVLLFSLYSSRKDFFLYFLLYMIPWQARIFLLILILYF